jgi:hypothetical protein
MVAFIVKKIAPTPPTVTKHQTVFKIEPKEKPYGFARLYVGNEFSAYYVISQFVFFPIVSLLILLRIFNRLIKITVQ